MSSFEDRFNALSSPQGEKDALSSTYNQQSSNSNLSFEERFNQFSHKKEKKPERSMTEKAGRLASQFGLGILQGSPSGIVYDIAAAPLASKEAQQVPYRENVMQDIERLLEQKQTGVWDQQDQELYDNLVSQMKDTSKSEPYIQTADVDLQSLAEKATGQDLKPEGVLENAAHWIGFIKKPANIKTLVQNGIKPSELTKAILPTGTDFLRGLGAGTALEMAKEGEFGPIGTMAAVVAGDLLGGGTSKAIKGTKKLITKPKETLAEIASSFTSKEKLELQKSVIKDFRDSGIKADLGSITDNNLIKWTQSRLAQSGLTGKALDDLRHEITNQIKDEYKVIAESLGEANLHTTHQAGEIVKEGIKSIRESELSATRQLYNNANKALKEKPYVDSNKLAATIERIEKDLLPGKIKSTEQQAVLNTIEKLKSDLYDSSGKLMYADVKDLMNNKVALNDIINYEVQGGSKQLLKGIVAEIDRAIISHGKENPGFAKNYVNANKQFSEHAKTFRNKEINQLLNTSDPAQVLNKMKSVSGIRSIGKILNKTPEGKEIFKNLKRMQFDKVVGDNLVDSTTKQIKLGTFSKLLEKGKNQEVMREILGPQAYNRLVRLQKNAGKLADAANKFHNASQSGVVAADAAIIAKGLSDISHLLVGNPWPLLKTTGGVLTARKLSGLLADPEFLKLVEDIILSSEKGIPELMKSVELIKPYILQATTQAPETS